MKKLLILIIIEITLLIALLTVPIDNIYNLGVAVRILMPSQGGTGNTQGIGTINTNRYMIGATDFTTSGGNNAGLPTWVILAILSGSNPSIAGTANHPGITNLKSSTTANSGYSYQASVIAFLLAGGETTELIFRLISETVTTIKFGFQDSFTITVPVDGVWINITNTILDGRTSNNSISSTTGTTYVLTTNTWYKVKITINSNATLVTYGLYSEAGALLWTNTLSTNIPTAAGRETGHGVVATDAGTTATGLVNLDYMNLYIDRDLIR